MSNLQTDNSPPASAPASSGSGGTRGDTFDRLYHMSTTAGLGSGDYVAINNVAVVAILMAGLSFLAITSDYLLVLPLVGVILASIAIWQIHGSNGTQGGKWLAILGLLVSLGFGGAVGVRSFVDSRRLAADTADISKLLETFSTQLTKQEFKSLYGMFTERFQTRVPEARFDDTFRALLATGGKAGILEMNWNQKLEVVDRGQIDIARAVWRFVFSMAQPPFGAEVVLVKSNGTWRIEDMPQLFQPPQATAGAGGGGGGGQGGQ